METQYLECSCTSARHMLRFILDDGSSDDCPEIYVEFQLNRPRSFWRRIWIGITYIFGYRCRFNHWDEVLLLKDQVVKLRSICDNHLEAWDRWEKVNGFSKKGSRNP